MSNRDQENKFVPDVFRDLELWEIRRRRFIQSSFVAGATVQLAFLSSCTEDLKKGDDLLSAEDATLLYQVLNILWPNDKNGPGIDDLKSYDYILWVLHTSINRYEEDNTFILDGITWMEETAQELYFKRFISLSEQQKAALVEQITITDWGERWCSALITLICESVLLDPIYGCQPNEEGWTWLQHTTGIPRPTEETRFENILTTVKNDQKS